MWILWSDCDLAENEASIIKVDRIVLNKLLWQAILKNLEKRTKNNTF
jgi:hypothetical protein